VKRTLIIGLTTGALLVALIVGGLFGASAYSSSNVSAARHQERRSTAHQLAVLKANNAKTLKAAIKKAHAAGYNEGGDAARSAAALQAAQEQTTGYHDPDTLARSMKHSLNDKAAEHDYSYRYTNITCISQGPRNVRFVCNADFDDGTATTLNVTVSATGDSWVSH
jgi:chorismate mutase